MSAPAALPFVAIAIAVAMAGTSTLWAFRFVTTAWIVLLRPTLAAWLVAGAAITGVGVLAALRAATQTWLLPEALVLTLWIVPFGAVPVLNLIAKRRRGGPPPVPEKDKALRLESFVFDVERARLRDRYEPPPLA